MKRISKLLIACSLIGSFVLTSCSSEPENNVIQSQDRNLVSISVKEGSVPDKIYVGEFDNAGIKLVLNYSDDTSEEINVTSAMLSSQYKQLINTPGAYTVEILYRKQRVVLRINIVPKDLTVNFYAYVDKNEYTLVDSQILPYRHDAVAPSVVNDFRYNGIHYYFNGWDVVYSDIKDNTNVYAQYSQKNYYLVTFVNGNNQVISSQEIDEGDNAVEPNEEVRNVDGYTFIGWDRSYLGISKDTIVYGLYKKVESTTFATEISIEDGKKVLIGLDQTYELNVLANSSNSSDFVWKSSDSNIVSVNNGIIITHAFGSAVVSVENDYVKASCLVEVSNKLPSKNNPLSVMELKQLLDDLYDSDCVLAQKLFFHGLISSYNTSNYNGTKYYSLTFRGENGSRLFNINYAIVDESVNLLFDNLSQCEVSIECKAVKNIVGAYEFDWYDEDGNMINPPIIYELTYPEASSININGFYSSNYAISLSNANHSVTFRASVYPANATMSEPFSWVSGDESVLSVDISGDNNSNCTITGLAKGQTTLTVSYKDITQTFNFAVDEFGTEENPLSLAEFISLSNLYPDYTVLSNCYIQGTITNISSSSSNRYSCTMSDGENSVTFTLSNELNLNATAIISTSTTLNGGTNISSPSLVSATGGIERQTIPVTLAEAFTIASGLEYDKESYDYYEITGYIAYKTSNNNYTYLSETLETFEEQPDPLQNFVIYKLHNYISSSKVPLLTKIKMISKLKNYHDSYFENGVTKEITVVKPAPSTDLVLPESVRMLEGKEVAITIISLPSNTEVTEANFTWADESQNIASIDENYVIHGLNAGETTLQVEYEGVVKYITITVIDKSTVLYDEFSSAITETKALVIASDGVVAKYDANMAKIGYELCDIEMANYELSQECMWEVAPVVQGENTYYTIKNVSSGLYITTAYHAVAYSDTPELYNITYNEDGTVDISAIGDNSPNSLYYNSSNKGFGFYSYFDRSYAHKLSFYVKK